MSKEFREFEEQLKKKGVIVQKINLELPKPGKLTVGNLYVKSNKKVTSVKG